MMPPRVILGQFVLRPPLPRSRFVWIALQVPIFAALYLIYSHRPITDPTAVNYDVSLYFNAATSVLKGQLPYRDFFFQYPPFALLFFIPPRWFAADLSAYFVWFNVELLALACIGVAVTGTIAREIGQPIRATLLVYSLALLAIGAIIPQRYDLAPAILVALALAAWQKGKHKAGYALLAVGTLTKIYPVLLLPLFAISELRTKGKRAVGRGLLVFGGLLLLVMLPFILLSPVETMNAFVSQAGRGVGIASLYATLMLVARPLGVPAQIVYEPALNTWNVQVPNAEWVAIAASGLQLALLTGVYLRFLRSPHNTGAMLVSYAALVIGMGILTSKVLSAQYIIWLFPIAFLIGDKRFVLASLLFLTTALLTQMLYPFLWNDLKQGALFPIVIALGRDVCLSGLCVLLLQTSPNPVPTSRATSNSELK